MSKKSFILIRRFLSLIVLFFMLESCSSKQSNSNAITNGEFSNNNITEFNPKVIVDKCHRCKKYLDNRTVNYPKHIFNGDYMDTKYLELDAKYYSSKFKTSFNLNDSINVLIGGDILNTLGFKFCLLGLTEEEIDTYMGANTKAEKTNSLRGENVKTYYFNVAEKKGDTINFLRNNMLFLEFNFEEINNKYINIGNREDSLRFKDCIGK